MRPPFHFPASQTFARLSALTLALGLGACAQLPPAQPLAAEKPLSAYQTDVSLSAPTTAWPQEEWWTVYGDEQLNALVAQALREAPDMAAAAARMRRAQALGQLAESASVPQVSVNASATRQKLSSNYLTPPALTPQGWQDHGRATLDLNWDLDFWGKNRAGLAAATSQIEASQADMAQARLSLVAAVASQYAQLLNLFAAQDTVTATVALRAKTVALFEERFANGLETHGTVSEAKARLAAAEGELLALQEQIGLQRNRIAALLGAGPDAGLRIERPHIALHRTYGLPPELASNLLGRRPDVVAARLLAQAQLRRIDQSRAAFYPNVNLSAFVGVQALGLDLLGKSGSDIGGIGPAMSLPIFNGGRLRADLRGSQAAYDEAVAHYDRTVTQALQEVANAALSQKALGGQLSKAQQAVQAAGEAHRVARQRYEGGLASYLEVLYAEDGLLASQRRLTTLQSQSFALDVALQRALGGGYQAPQQNTPS